MTRLLETDPRLRKLCMIKTDKAAYPRRVLSKFTRKVREDNLNRIFDEKVVKLLTSNKTREIDVVSDASFIKAWSIRDPTDNQKWYSGT